MEKLRIGVLGPSDIAGRRFVPGILASDEFTYVGVAYAGPEERGGDVSGWDDPAVSRGKQKAEQYQQRFGGQVYRGFQTMLEDAKIDAVYVPLPPALHARWGKEALEHGKHVLLEKPFTTRLSDTEELLRFAEEKGLAVHENFAYLFHRQIAVIEETIRSGALGELRLIRSAFCFPYRGEDDFRYHAAMGGGALLDCGGYPLSLADHLLGGIRVAASVLSPTRGHDVDVCGSVLLVNDDGLTAQVAFGMDNAYRCDVEVWGSRGVLSTGRVFSPPADLRVDICVKTDTERHILVEPDDQFRRSAEFFAGCIRDRDTRMRNDQRILARSRLLDAVQNG